MKKLDGKAPLYEEIITIVLNRKKTIEIMQMDETFENDTMITLDKCLEIAKEEGYTNGTILVIAESYLDGKIYRYNNYSEGEWCEVGTMAGFA